MLLHRNSFRKIYIKPIILSHYYKKQYCATQCDSNSAVISDGISHLVDLAKT